MNTHQHALGTVVVAGGSVAGLLAAAAVAPHARRVVVVERDELPEQPGPRQGTPQAVHTHGLLASGRAAMEELLPGLTADLVLQGALSGDVGGRNAWYLGGHRVLPVQAGADGMLVSRLLLEAYLRARVRDVPNVRVLDRTDVRGLLAGGPATVSGVLLQDLADPTAPPEELAADLVVDATGRPGRASRWFGEHGWPVPTEDRVVIGVRYRTVHVPHVEGELEGADLVISAATPGAPRVGAAMRQEDGAWTVTLVGYLEDEPPAEPSALRAFARTVVAPELATLLDRDVLGEPAVCRFPHSVRRRIERTALPAGYAVIGDAICSFNPVFGQGMSVAALQAAALEEALASTEGPAGLAAGMARYHRDAVERADRAWTLVVGADLQIPGVRGERPRGHAAVASYVHRAQRAASHDPVVARALLRVTALVDPPSSLMRPALLARVLGSSVRQPVA